MKPKKKALFNWSSGKDSALALYKILQGGEFELTTLLTSVNQHHRRVSMHGVRLELLQKQAQSIGLPLCQMLLPETPSMEDYNRIVGGFMSKFKKEGVRHSIFGDIFLEDLRTYREEQLKKIEIEAVFPLWGQSTRDLAIELIDLGFKAVVVCVNEKYLDNSFVGRILDRDFFEDIPANVDPCGENGEYHTFVFDGPIFKAPIKFEAGEVVRRVYESSEVDNSFYFCDLIPA